MAVNRKIFFKTLGVGIGTTVLGLENSISSDSPPRFIPQTLQKGDTIGMISPASSLLGKEEYGKARQSIEEPGFSVQKRPY